MFPAPLPHGRNIQDAHSQALTLLLLALHRGAPDRVTQDGNTALHYSVLYNQPNCLKLLLKGKATFSAGMRLAWGFFGGSGKAATWICPSSVPWAVNAAGETALDVARRLKYSECEELVGGMGEWGRSSAWGEGTKRLRRAGMKVGGASRTCPPSAETPVGCPVLKSP